MDHFQHRDGRLFAEDVDIGELAAAVGTPFYCYSTATIERHFTVFRGALAWAGDPLIAAKGKAVPRFVVVSADFSMVTSLEGNALNAGAVWNAMKATSD